MAHDLTRKLPTNVESAGCIPVSIIAEQSQARGNNCPSTDRLWDVVTRLSEAAGRQQAEINQLKEQINA